MKGMKRGRTLLLYVLISMLLLGGDLLPQRAVAEGRAPAEYVFTDYAMSYQLESFLNGYNVLAFGDVYLGLHCIGGLLVQGDYDGGPGNSGFADGENMPPSYIKGRLLAPNSVYNSRNHRVDPLYVGSANVVSSWQAWYTTYYSVNGLRTGSNGTTPVYVSDHFFNFDLAYQVVKNSQTAMQHGSTPVEADKHGRITIPMGSQVTIASLEGVREINLTGNEHASANTTIVVLEEGDLHLPAQLVNGRQPAVVEQADEGVSIVWSFPAAASLQLPTQNWLGHVIAPDADVTQQSGNYNGCIVCKNLYSSAEGHLYNYAARENSWTTVFSVQKVWNDGDNVDGIRPQSVRVQLLADGKPYGKAVELRESGNWFHVWEKLPETDEAGKPIAYTVQEVDVPEGYAVSYDQTAGAIINTHEYETVEISGSKTWNDNDNQDGKRPASITIRLLADGRDVAQRTVTAANGWAWSFTGLPKYENGREIAYTITEDDVPGYTKKVSGYDVANTYKPETVEVSGSKTWRDDGDQDGKRPASITIRLLAGGREVAQRTVTAADGWAWSFTGLPKYENGREIAYTITEDAVIGYTTMIDGYDVINSRVSDTTSVSGRKLWFDDDDVYGRRPASITVYLLANGRRIASRVVTEADGWAWNFENLPVNEDGSPIAYTVDEEPVPDYETFILGYNILNSYDRTTFSVTKIWEGPEGGDVVLTLYADGERLNPQPEYRREGSMYIWEELPVFNAQGEEIVYSATERYMDGYLTIYENVGPFAGETDRVYEGGTIINRGVVNVFVRKVWDGFEEGVPLPDIELVLYCNGEPTGVPMPKPDKYGWYKYYNLPAEVDGEPAKYTVRETKMNGYMAVYTNMQGEPTEECVPGGIITNYGVPATGDETPLLLWAALMAVSGAGLAILRRRRA